jgi:uncharacterized protein (TIGR00251 family)
MSFYKVIKDRINLSVYVVPRSSKTEVIGLYGDFLKIKLKSPPVDNEANEELIRYISEKLKISKSNIRIVSGQTQKKKILSLFGGTIDKIKTLLTE